MDDTEAVQVAAALHEALHQQGLVARDADRPPGDHRLVTVDPATSTGCTVEIFPDGGRLHGRVILDVGPVLHPDNLAADEVLALCGRTDRGTSTTSLPARPLRPRPTAGPGRRQGQRIHHCHVRRRAAPIHRLGPADWTEDGIAEQGTSRLYALFDQCRDRLTGSDTT